MSLWEAIADHISQARGRGLRLEAPRPVGGGCINAAYVVASEGERFFVKTNAASGVEMFEAEAQGLQEIASSGAVRAPCPICWGGTGEGAYLVLEYLDLGGRGGGERLGEKLAGMHRHTRSCFGWHRDNTIGSTPQINTESADWVAFWRDQRLGFQLDLAARNGYGGRLQHKGERLLADIGALFAGYSPRPSLLHGDLWSGNYAVDRAGEPVIFDPAVYYGDREADLAMTELFGGFAAGFYAAYRDAWPLDPGYEVRKVLYNLYHILNHLNLFGGGYGSQAEHMADRLLAQIR